MEEGAEGLGGLVEIGGVEVGFGGVLGLSIVLVFNVL